MVDCPRVSTLSSNGAVNMIHTTSSRSLLLVTSLAGIIVLAGLAFKILCSTSDKNDPDDSDPSGDTDQREGLRSMVPTHLKRLLYKEQRRKDSVRFLAMKKPMYDNIEMYSPEGVMLCTISKKKAAWYIGKNLATWKTETQSIQLLFKPKGQPSGDDNYHVSHKKNVCVVCGDSEKFMRHYVVPYCYRALFPSKYKTHMPHDIVILCPDCHVHSEKSTQERQKKIELSLRTMPGTDHPHIPDRELHRVKSAALALCNRREQIPPEKVKEHEATVKMYFGLDQSSWLSHELLIEATTMETSIPNPTYIPGPELVVSSLAYDEESIESFILDWREHFLHTMQPRFLPTGWSIDSPVHI